VREWAWRSEDRAGESDVKAAEMQNGTFKNEKDSQCFPGSTDALSARQILGMQ
jgi:hypothetical protein